MEVKVCGITRLGQLEEVHRLGADYAGIIFYPPSPRYGPASLDAAQVSRVAGKKAGVFVDAGLEEVKKAVQDWQLAAVQLHGNESPDYCAQLQGRAEVIKVFRLDGSEDVDELVAPFAPVADGFLFDTATPAYGGSGKRFDATRLFSARIGKPFFLSGGLGPEDVSALARLRHPFFRGADINSRFETEPGVKNMEAVASFIRKIKDHG